MVEIGPGQHPNFDMTFFDVPQQRVLRRLCQLTHLNRHGEVTLGKSTKYKYALVRPAHVMRSLLHTDREVMVLFSEYGEFQSRTLDAFDRIINDLEDDFRVEKVARILVSDDSAVSSKIKALFQSKPDAPVVIPFYTGELTLSASDQRIADRIREFTFSRDLFSMSSPLRSDLYFYGRSSLINEICSKLSSGENFGLFGLRRSGKTSIVHGINRAIRTRNGAAIIVDCQSPGVHQRRWNELLEHIVISARDSLASSAQISPSSKYSEKDAAETFLKDMRSIKKNLKKDFLAILFDEIERITIGTASSNHWNSERDFLLFWQSIRYGFQNSSSPYSFLIVGTNPSAVERVRVFESDNPLFGNVEKRFIPMFTTTQVNEMVDDLGEIMGVRFTEDCKAKLHIDFGGHPFLTRYACSYIANSTKTRPVTVDRTVYAVGIDKFKNESESYVDSVVGLLKEEYSEEHEMLKYLGSGDTVSFEDFALDEPGLSEHLIGYGIIERGQNSHFFRIGVVEDYFARLAKPVRLLGQSSRISEISTKRNHLEKSIRAHVYSVFKVSFSAKNRKDKLLAKLTQARRDVISAFDFERILSPGESPVYFDELKAIILGNWDNFQNSLDIEKSELEYHLNTINRFRVDAHSKDISDEDFEKFRVSIHCLETIFS